MIYDMIYARIAKRQILIDWVIQCIDGTNVHDNRDNTVI